MKSPNDQRKHAIEAYEILNEFIGDLVAGTRTIELYDLPAVRLVMTPDYQIATTRLCIFHIIITLFKWIEFYDRYKSIIPKDVREESLHLRESLLVRGVRDFRNKVVWHIWDKTSNRPLTEVV